MSYEFTNKKGTRYRFLFKTLPFLRMVFPPGGLINQQNIILLSLVYLSIIFLLNYKEFQQKKTNKD